MQELSLTHGEWAKVKVGLRIPRGAKDKQQRTNTPATGNGDLFKLLANRNRNLYNHSSKRGFSESGGEWQPGLPHHSGNLETQLRKGRWLQLWLSTSLEQINKLFPSNLVRFLLWWPSKGSNAA